MVRSGEEDTFGRRFDKDKFLAPPSSTVHVTGTLFHTQGGLLINNNAQICREDGGVVLAGFKFAAKQGQHSASHLSDRVADRRQDCL